MSKMPIKQSFCNSWYEACYNDLFCGAGGRGFYSCAKASPTSQPSVTPSIIPSYSPSITPTSIIPTIQPSIVPTTQP